MRAWALVALATLACVVGPSLANMTVRPNNSATGDPTATRITGPPYPFVVFAEVDSVSTVADQYTGETPNAAAYVDTIGVARDWNNDGSVDSTGVGEWASLQFFVIEYCGIGPDTMWVRGLDESGNVIWETRKIPPTNVSRQCYSWDPIFARASRMIVFAGRASQPSIDDWTITAYFER